MTGKLGKLDLGISDRIPSYEIMHVQNHPLTRVRDAKRRWRFPDVVSNILSSPQRAPQTEAREI